MANTLQDLLGFDPREVAGARVSGEIPIPDVTHNRLIAERLASSPGKVAAIVLQSKPSNQATAHVRLNMAFVPPLVVNLAIASQPAFPNLPVVVVRWSLAGLDSLAKMAMPFISGFLPPWARIDGDLIAVDLRGFARAKGQEALLEYVKSVRVETAEGRLVVHFELGVSGKRRPGNR